MESVHPSPHTQAAERSVSAGVKDREKRGEERREEGVVKESRAGRAGRGGKKRECALVVSFAARLPPSALEKPVLPSLA